jgi:hypothetical protein
MHATQPKSTHVKLLHTIRAVAEKETIIAILMALVAMLGMMTAYRTATAEEDVSLKESKLTQSRFLELTKREELLVRFSDSARFEVAKDAHLKWARECRRALKSPDRSIPGKLRSSSCKRKKKSLSPEFSSPILISQKFLGSAIRISASTRL